MVPFDQRHDKNIICCCKSSIPHDESMKFILKVDDPKNLDLVLFENQPPGDVKELFEKNIYNKIFHQQDEELDP